MSLFLVLAILGGFLVLLSNILYIVAGFRESVVWGLVNLFIPLGVLVFTVVKWEAAKGAFITMILGTVFLGAGGILAARVGALNDVVPNANLPALLSKVDAPSKENLTQEIDQLREEVMREREFLADRTNALAAEYSALSEKRKGLNSSDPAAVAEFNRLAAAYKENNDQTQAQRDELAAKEKRLETILAQRNAGAPPAEAH